MLISFATIPFYFIHFIENEKTTDVILRQPYHVNQKMQLRFTRLRPKLILTKETSNKPNAKLVKNDIKFMFHQLQRAKFT